jgi:hypothetical protein
MLRLVLSAESLFLFFGHHALFYVRLLLYADPGLAGLLDLKGTSGPAATPQSNLSSR